MHSTALLGPGNPVSSVRGGQEHQGAFHALRPEDLRRKVSYPVGVAAWIQLKLYYLAHRCNKMQTSTHGSFDLCASGVRQASGVAPGILRQEY